MIIPIYAYGQPVLKRAGEEIDSTYAGLEKLIENMWDTMYNAKGIGLAAPQVGKSIKLFVADTKQLEDDEKDLVGIKQVFINPIILEENGEEESYEEGCLSIPDVRGDVMRKPEIHVQFQDENFQQHKKSFKGINARVIQHEYDHVIGKLFTEQLQPLRKRMIKRKLESIKKGKIATDYRMRFVIK